MLSPATAVVCHHLLPIDGITDARKPFVKRFSNAVYLERPTSARGISPASRRNCCSAPEKRLGPGDSHWRIFVRDCGSHRVGSRAAPCIVPTMNCFGLKFLHLAGPFYIVSDECLHCAIWHPLVRNYAVRLAIAVEALTNQHPRLKTTVRTDRDFGFGFLRFCYHRDCGFIASSI